MASVGARYRPSEALSPILPYAAGVPPPLAPGGARKASEDGGELEGGERGDLPQSASPADSPRGIGERRDAPGGGSAPESPSHSGRGGPAGSADRPRPGMGASVEPAAYVADDRSWRQEARGHTGNRSHSLTAPLHRSVAVAWLTMEEH